MKDKGRKLWGKKLAAGLGMAGIGLLLTACSVGNSGSSTAGGGSAADSGTSGADLRESASVWEIPEYVPEGREVVWIGTFLGEGSLPEAVKQFNESNDTYWAELLYYGQQQGSGYSIDTGSAEGQAALNRVQIALTTGTDCPDLMIMDSFYMDISALAAQGCWEDLNPYLERSDELSAEDFLEGIPEAYTYDGKLITLPRYIELSLLCGEGSRLKQYESWTAEDLIAYGEQYPESTLVSCDDIPSYTLLMYGEVFGLYEQPPFVTVEAGREIVNREQLASFLERVRGDSEKKAESMADSGETLDILLYKVYITNLWDIQLIRSYYEGDAALVGYPSEDGRNVKIEAFSDPLYGIPYYAGNKEGAWAFLEFYLSLPMDSEGTIPAQKDAFEALLQRDMLHEGYEVNEEGILVLEGTNSPMRTYGDGEETFSPGEIQEEDIELLMELLSRAGHPFTKPYTELVWLKILAEEAGAYFQEQKSLEEVTDIAAGRLQLYLDEKN